MTDIPDDIMKAANECVAQFRWNNDNRWHLFVARAIQEERERCISAVIDAANAGKYTPLSELASAIRGDETEREAME